MQRMRMVKKKKKKKKTKWICLTTFLAEKIFFSSLITAAANGNFTTVQSLLEQGADKNEVTNWGRTALWHASREGHLEIVRLLVERGADMEKCHNNRNVTALWVATSFNQLEVVRYLLEQGADRDCADFMGETPLHIASEYGHLEITKLLMAYGADINARNNDGRLPIDIAGEHEGDVGIIEEIRQAIRDEPRRRLDEAPGKRATEEDRHPTAATSASTQQEDDEEEEEPSNKWARLESSEEEQTRTLSQAMGRITIEVTKILRTSHMKMSLRRYVVGNSVIVVNVRTQ